MNYGKTVPRHTNWNMLSSRGWSQRRHYNVRQLRQAFPLPLLPLCIYLCSSSYSSSSLVVAADLSNNCNITISSLDHASTEKNGTISSPGYPERYPRNLRCVYNLIGLPTERVRVKFLDFDVKGLPPRCTTDYVDVYTQVREPFQDLLDTPLHGRYCGSDVDELPRILVSMYSVFVVGFYSDQSKEERGFLAEYTFIDGSVYNVGTPAPPSICGQTVYGYRRPHGVLMSPTFPGVYPDNLFCYYRLHGVAGQRIRLFFNVLDLYSGGDHCPFDYVRVYDGSSNASEAIGTYCGSWRNAPVYSTKESMYIEFVTKSGRVEPTRRPYARQDTTIQRSGFSATFDISGDFVDLDFIKEGHHVRGTECDQMVLSTGESGGTISSPNYPNNYPLNVTCHYYIDGLVDKQNLEKAKLYVDDFDVPTIRDGCNNGFLSAYVRGQDITHSAADFTFCGSSNPDPIVTSNPRLLLIFNTTNARYSGHGFKARFQFLTDYAIPGTPATNTGGRCHFIYRRSAAVHGTFNSPRHPSNYPDNTTCVYEFFGGASEQVRITFENFKIENNHKDCSTDYVDVYSLAPRPGSPSSSTNVDDLEPSHIGHYCSELLPGPLTSEENASALRIVLTSNNDGVNTGFRAKYEFIERKPISRRCFKNITTGVTGHIDSPNYPHKYLINSTCEWLIATKNKDSRILLTFDIFTMEGNMEKTGCGNAVLKVYANQSTVPTHELCGSSPQNDQIISLENSIRVKFISSARAVGAKGFKLWWTVFQVQPTAAAALAGDGWCGGFHCRVSGYCIASELRCNKLSNCGRGDNSDESECTSYNDHGVLHAVLGVVIALAAFVFVVVCILHRRRKRMRRRRKAAQRRQSSVAIAVSAVPNSAVDGHPPTPISMLKDGGGTVGPGGGPIEVRYVSRAAAAASPGGTVRLTSSPTSRSATLPLSGRTLKEKTEKVSIV